MAGYEGVCHINESGKRLDMTAFVQHDRQVAQDYALLPADGICLYPIMDRPDWENEKHWHNSGLGDLETEGKGAWRRILNENYATDLKVAQNRLTNQPCNYQPISQT